MTTPDPLAALRDVRLPEAVTWWPPAPGWWVLLALLLVGVVLVVVMNLWRRRSLRQAALAELAALRADIDAGIPATTIATDVGVLIRRVGLARSLRPDLPTLHGAAWSEQLAAGDGGLPAALADWVAAAPYAAPDVTLTAGDQQAIAANDVLNPRVLVDAAERWIRKNAL